MEETNKIKVLKLNLENQLDYLDKPVFDRNEIFPQDVLEQIDVAECQLLALMYNKIDIKDYELRLNQIKEKYGVSYGGFENSKFVREKLQKR